MTLLSGSGKERGARGREFWNRKFFSMTDFLVLSCFHFPENYCRDGGGLNRGRGVHNESFPQV